MKKAIAFLATCIMLVFFVSCSCKHEWQSATCISPKECTICGETEGEALGHDFDEATCVKARTCIMCGETEGEALGHDFDYATCTKLKTCTICGETEGLFLSHDYNEGYCIMCGVEDPNYINLNNLGFRNTYGMNEWIEISAYNYRENRVTISNNFYFQIYCGNYWQYGTISKEFINTITNVSTDLFDSIKTEPYTLLSNDVIQYNGATGWGPVTIIERVVSSDNKKIVIKINDQTSLSGSREEWYVPADLLDFSTMTAAEEGNKYYISYK